MSEQGIQYLDPRAEPSAPIEVYELGLDLSAEGLTLGLMANGFPDSDTFLDHIADAVTARLPGIRFRRYNKGNASRLADETMLSDAAENCDAVIAAYGH